MPTVQRGDYGQEVQTLQERWLGWETRHTAEASTTTPPRRRVNVFASYNNTRVVQF